MDVELLKTFLEVNRTRHFGQAAENLCLSQSAVSARIRLLEDTVGVALFTRSRHNIQLTAAGERLLRHAERIVTTWNQARQDIALGDEARMSLQAGGVPGLADVVLQRWLHALSHNFDDVVVQAEVHGPALLMRRLQERTLDLGFLFEAPQAPELMVHALGNLPLVLVASRPGLTVEQALGENYVLVDWGTAFATSHARHFPDLPPPRLRVGLGRMAQSYLLECGGAAYLAEPAVAAYTAAGQLHRVAGAPVIDRAVYAVYPAHSEKRAVIEQTLVGVGGLSRHG